MTNIKEYFIFVDAWTGALAPNELYAQNGSELFDTLTKLVLSSIGKNTLESETKNIRTEVENLAADKIINVFKKPVVSKEKDVGNLIAENER